MFFKDLSVSFETVGTPLGIPESKSIPNLLDTKLVLLCYFRNQLNSFQSDHLSHLIVETIAMIEAIPIMIPSIVRNDRILCVKIPRNDNLMFSIMM